MGLKQEHPGVGEELWYLRVMTGVLKLRSEPVRDVDTQRSKL